jgi:hypothetical protein
MNEYSIPPTTVIRLPAFDGKIANSALNLTNT